MTNYVKLIGETQLEKLTNDKALNYLDTEELNAQGYKEFIPATKEKGKPYKYTYEETETQIIEHAEEIIPDPIDILKSAKEQKIQENDEKRDNALNRGVVYKDVLFDSDTDQKVNLLATVQELDDTTTVIWFGKDNQPLECKKADLIAIGGLITELHSYCWQTNYEIKVQINDATTVEEVQEIVIDYGENE